MPKRALVVSGGGAKGAFAVGVIKALASNPPHLDFDIYVGTSTGSLIVPFAAMGELDQLETVYTSVTTANIVQEDNVADRFLGANSLLNVTPLAQMITTNYTDAFCNGLFQSPKAVYIVTTCLQTGETVYFSNQPAPAGTNTPVIRAGSPDIFRRAIMASACQPVLMSPIEVEQGKNPLRQYVDGGVRMYAGIQFAIDAGADEVYAILLSPAGNSAVETNFSHVFDILERTIDIFTQDTAINNVRQPTLYSAGLRYIADIKSARLARGVGQAEVDQEFNIDPGNPFQGRLPVKIFVIRPDSPLGGGPGGLSFNPVEMKGMVAKGEGAADAFLANPQPISSAMV